MKKIIPLLILVFALQSCENKTKKSTKSEIKMAEKLKKEYLETKYKNYENRK